MGSFGTGIGSGIEGLIGRPFDPRDGLRWSRTTTVGLLVTTTPPGACPASGFLTIGLFTAGGAVIGGTNGGVR